MTADIITASQLLHLAGPAALVFLVARPLPLHADAEPTFLFRSEGFAEDLGDTYSSS